jgi:hydrogenase/urease accessory protein HupE
MRRRFALAPLLAAGLAALLIAAPGAAHPGHGEGFGGAIPHPFHHADLLLGVLSVAAIAGAVAWRVARRRRAQVTRLRAA